MTSQMISQLINEFRQLQVEVTELKAEARHVEKPSDEEGSFRYQLYYGDGCERQAR